MSVQFIIGASGTGKSYYLNHLTAEEACKNPEQNYIMLVPEQFTSELQREMIQIHAKKGFMNIDIIGFNRLAYRVFEEQNVKVGPVLEDFGKSMLIRRIAGELKDELSVYKNSIDKHGFIDEVKSLMSELFTYYISEEDIKSVMTELSEEDALYLKLKDMTAIYHAFTEWIGNSYIVAEQTTELLADYIKTSELIKKSIISLDGFTGFTPVQMKLMRELLLYAKKVRITITIDKEHYFKKSVREHELYFLSKQTLDRLDQVIDENGVTREDSIILEWEKENGRFLSAPMIEHLEQHIFRYPIVEYARELPKEESLQDETDVQIWECSNRREEMACIAEAIRRNVKAGMRYSDMAVVTGDLEHLAEYAEPILEDYGIPYFMDYNREMKNNPFIEAICLVVEMIDKNYDYDSVFAFLKSGIVPEFTEDIVEMLENYVIARGIRGHSGWSRPITNANDTDLEEARMRFLEITEPIFQGLKKKQASVSDYVSTLVRFTEVLDYENQILQRADIFEAGGNFSDASAYRHLHEKLQELFQKMSTIMPNEKLPLHDFLEIMKLGMSEISMGIIPPTQDMVVIGDINRTRLGKVKVLFLANINDGIIPAAGNPGKILNDRDREKLEKLGVELAPTERMNTFIEQFYLYLIMTKPEEKLIMSYSLLGNDNASIKPSYLISRVLRLFPGLFPIKKSVTPLAGTYESDILFLTKGIRELLESPADADVLKTALLYHLYQDFDGMIPAVIREAVLFNNGANTLSKDARDAIKTRLLAQSVSKLQRYAGCAYSYFLQYGLRLNERRRYEMDARNIGNILHLALKETFTEIRKNHNNDWSALSEEAACNIMKEKLEAACENEKSGVLSEEGRAKFLLESIHEAGSRTIRTLRYQILNGKMNPVYFEKEFSGLHGVQEAMLEVQGQSIPLKGIIDRGDLKIDDENIYVKLVDYKTGKGEFKIEEVYEGLELQLVVYMNILMEMVSRDYPGKNIIPAGMYYYHVDNPYLSEEEADESALEEKLCQALRLRGVPNSDSDIMEMQEQGIHSKAAGTILPVDYTKRDRKFKSSVVVADTEQFNQLFAYGKSKMVELTENILAGKIAKRPIKNGRFSRCEYCAYKEVCRFDEKLPGNKIRNINYNETEKKLLWAEMTVKADADKGGEFSDGGLE